MLSVFIYEFYYYYIICILDNIVTIKVIIKVKYLESLLDYFQDYFICPFIVFFSYNDYNNKMYLILSNIDNILSSIITLFAGYPVQYRHCNAGLIFHSCFASKKLLLINSVHV